MYLMGCYAKVHSYDILKMFCWTKLFFINVTNKFGFIYAIFATIWKLSKYGVFFWSLFSCIQTEHGDLRSKSPHSVQYMKNTDQKKLCVGKLFTPMQHLLIQSLSPSIIVDCAFSHEIILVSLYRGLLANNFLNLLFQMPVSLQSVYVGDLCS